MSRPCARACVTTDGATPCADKHDRTLVYVFQLDLRADALGLHPRDHLLVMHDGAEQRHAPVAIGPRLIGDVYGPLHAKAKAGDLRQHDTTLAARHGGCFQ